MERGAFVRLCRARRALREASDPPRSVRAVAEEAGYSVYHFIRAYRALFGETPHEARVRHRIGRAKRILADGRESVTTVCMEVGCSSLGSFSAQFAARTGEPPSTFRRRVRLEALEVACLELMTAPQFPRSGATAVAEYSSPEGTCESD